MSTEPRFKVGIDVGGTFTHAVALDAVTSALVGKAKVPTTHRAQEGVARGIIDSLRRMLESSAIKPEQVVFIAHSTTQATNALLEGDVAKVGILSLGTGASAWLVRNATTFGAIPLAIGKVLPTYTKFMDSKDLSKKSIQAAFAELKERGAQAFVISEAFSVDQPNNERFALAVAEELGLLATAGSDISQLYGLRTRTRTAVINACMLPKMLESADLTERCVRESGITAPLMIMRSDGGVMDINSMRRRPIYTMLSGPAAGVAAALMFLRISDGIFLEVGGTSTDISAIHNGRSKIRSAEVGGNNLLMKTLDIHTVGVAGGSLAQVERNRIAEIGPRSAHIANYLYVSFTDTLDSPEVLFQPPLPGDSNNYVAIRDKGHGETLSLTPTCAANLLGYVPEGDCAIGNLTSISKSFEALGKLLGKTAQECAEDFLNRAIDKCLPKVKALIQDNKLDEKTVVLYGGGGGAAALVPYLAKRLNLRCELAQSADVLSAIGVALALLRETLERQILNPTSDDILRLRQEAVESVQSMGAAESTIDVFVEYDAQKNILRATATGAASVLDTKTEKNALAQEEKLQVAADSMRLKKEQVKLMCATANFSVYMGETSENGWRSYFGFLSKRGKKIRLLDKAGSIRFQAKDGEATLVSNAGAEDALKEIANRWCRWGDAGKSAPHILLLAKSKIIDLSGLLEMDQISALAQVELEKLPKETEIIVLATPNA